MKKKTLSNLSKCKSIMILAIAFICSISFAQNRYTVEFQDKTVEIPENINSFQWSQMPESSQLENGYFGWVQFYETPNQTIQNRFKLNDLQLLEYIPNRTYLFYFPETTSISFLKENGVRAVVPVNGSYKLSSTLKNLPYEEWATEGDNILVTLQHHKNVNTDYVINDLATQQITVKTQYKGSNNIDLSIPNNCLEALSNLPYVKWVELIVAPSIHDDTRGRSLHRSSGLDTQTGVGGNYTGAGIGVMCRDDGPVGPHIDFKGRITGLVGANIGTHGDGVSGIMAGAGNLNPSNRGMAAGSSLHVVQYQANFLDSATTTNITDGTTQITNSSYSNGCNDGYTTITQTVDQQTKDNPTVLHVFSAGNSNNNDCGYGAGNQWGNITGGHKQGKNVITTANVFFDGSLVNSSSRGPAHDGRIKPDIAANGQNQISTSTNNTYQSFGGTSGAAPGIAGISAQLYELYGDVNGGALPPSALIKATLLNTANDYGNIGPDFKFGWGIVNALRAGMLIEDSRYLSDNISQGDSNTHTINVPSGTEQVKFMVYWSDPAASPGASPSLVNDLDLVVTDPSSGPHLPWILDETPNSTTLDLPATTGADHLNNMEQVLLNSPDAGNYDIEIMGFDVPMGPQEYFVLYEIISEEVTVIYPNAEERFVLGETEQIHWDAIDNGTGFDLDYSIDNGAIWNTIASVASNITNYAWSVPSNVTGEALIRVTRGSYSDTSDETFSIAELVNNMELTQVCPDNATFAWSAVVGAESYDVYMLGTTYMEVVGNSVTTSLNVAITDPMEPIWAAIVAKNDTEGWQSRRTIAINHPGGLLNCSLTNDIGTVGIDNDPADFNLVCSGLSDIIISVTYRNTGLDPQSNFTVSYQLDSDPVVEETFTGTLNSGEQDSYTFTTPLTIATSGSYTLTVSAALLGDENASNDEVVMNIYIATEATQLNFTETFETNGFPPASWSIENPDDDITWTERTGVPGSDGNATVTSFIDNFAYNASNEVDNFETEIFDLTSATSAFLTFDLAKAQYSTTFFDTMRVEVSIDCGITYEVVYDKTDLDLSTVPGYITTSWTPAGASDWRNESIDLAAYLGENVMVRFVNVNGYGNSTYVDNISVTSVLGVEENVLSESVSLYPNPATNQVHIAMNNVTFDKLEITVVNNLGQRIQTIDTSRAQGDNNISINVRNLSSGLYFVTIKADDTSITKKLLIE